MAKKSYVDTILDELTQSGDVEAIELGNILAKTDISDKEMRQYINSGKGYYSRKWPNDLLAKMPTFRKALYSEPAMNTVKDFDKAFNDPNWDKEYIKGNIPEDQLDFIAEENGISKERLKELMNKEVTLRDRARDMDVDLSLKGVQNFITRAVFPRSTERYLKGDDIQGRDIALDAGENFLYMIPYGFAAKALTNGGRAATLALAGSNAINPTITEAADALVYSNDPENERSVFQPTDVAKGTFINMAAPYALLRGAGTAGRRYGFPEVGKRIEEIGTGTTAKDLKNQWINDVSIVNKQRSRPNATPVKQKNDTKTIIESKDYKANLTPSEQAILTGENSTQGIIYMPGKNYEEKFAEFYNIRKEYDRLNKEYNKLWNDVNVKGEIGKEPLLKQKDAEIKKLMMSKNPDYEILAKHYENWIPTEQIAQAENLKNVDAIAYEEALKNYVTNKTGDMLYSDQPDKLTLIGRLFRKSPKTKKEEQEAKEYEEQLNYLYDKYKLPDYREAK